MTLDELEVAIERRIEGEQRENHALILLLAEAMRRKLYAHRGQPTMLRWLVKRFRLAEDAAYRRIAAARLICEVPAAGDKLARGDVTLTALAKVHSAVRHQKKPAGAGSTKPRLSHLSKACPFARPNSR